ncbi:MAG: ferritin-like fold-containing protein [Bowdeniella nasicola]|nr:ferritin-like fold-containing protein [Bowdeniella nasicola]
MHTETDDALQVVSAALMATFSHLADDAAHAPTYASQLRLAQLACAAVRPLSTLQADHEPRSVGGQARRVFADFRARTVPQDWPERLAKTYVALAVARDVLREVAAPLAERYPDLAEQSEAAWASADLAEDLAALIDGDPRLTARLSLWTRRVMGESLAVARTIATLAPALMPSEGIAAGLARITRAHSARMSALGLTP